MYAFPKIPENSCRIKIMNRSSFQNRTERGFSLWLCLGPRNKLFTIWRNIELNIFNKSGPQINRILCTTLEVDGLVPVLDEKNGLFFALGDEVSGWVIPGVWVEAPPPSPPQSVMWSGKGVWHVSVALGRRTGTANVHVGMFLYCLPVSEPPADPHNDRHWTCRYHHCYAHYR